MALPEQAAVALSRNPNVVFVEPDSAFWAFGSQSNATWGLDQSDQRTLPLDHTYNYAYDGTGVTAYIIDTGFRHCAVPLPAGGHGRRETDEAYEVQ